MRQNKMTKIVAFMLSMVMISSVFVGNTLSRYVTSVSSTDNARVAVWGINGEEVTMELFNTAYDLDGKKIAEANLNDDGVTRDKIIAPGTGGSSAFSIINFMDTAIPPEVAYQVKIELDDTAVDERIKTNSSIQWKLDNNDWGTWEQLVGSLLLLSGDQSGVKVYEPGTFATAFKDNAEHKISWQWAMDGNNTVDTQMGNDALTGDISAKVTVRVTAQQVDDLTTNAYLIDGANQVVNLNYVQPITLKSSADFGTFESVLVNGNPITRDTDYTAVSGSTVITLKAEYLSNLETGVYTIDIVSSENTASTNFYVVDDLEDNMPMLAASDTWYKASVPRSSLKTINIVDEASEDIINNADESWPAAIDYAGDGELDDDVMCYVDGDTLTIAGNGSGKVYANYDSSWAFSDHNRLDYFKNVETFSNTNLLDTSNVINMEKLFYEMIMLDTVDVSNWDVSNVTNMKHLFASSTADAKMALTSLDVSNWDVSNVTNMSSMFQICRNLTFIDVSNWDTSNVTDMSYMFNMTSGGIISNLDVSNWDTGNVTDMSFMFYGAKDLQTLDVSNWDVSKVKSFDHMLAHSKVVIDPSNWYTPSAVNMNAMFHSVRSTVLDVSNLDTSNVEIFSQMFDQCYVLEEIIGLENFDTSSGVDFSQMFYACYEIKELDLSSFDTRKAKNGVVSSANGSTSQTLENMFWGMRSLEKVIFGPNFSFNGDGSNKNTNWVGVLPTPSSPSIPGAAGIWYNTAGEILKSEDIPSFVADTYKVYVYPEFATKDTWYKGTTSKSKITEINIVDSYTPSDSVLESWDASSVNNGSLMCYIEGTTLTIAGNGTGKILANSNSTYIFNDFSKVTAFNGLDLIDTSNVTNMEGMFRNCKSITSIDLSSWDTSKVTKIRSLFNTCSSLTSVNLSGWNISNVTDMAALFYNCTKLTNVNLSSFDTGKVTTMDNVFYGCTSLETIYVSNKFVTTKVSSGKNMFYNCTKLVGGNGTVYDPSVSIAYARIDKEGTPGYFTAK